MDKTTINKRDIIAALDVMTVETLRTHFYSPIKQFTSKNTSWLKKESTTVQKLVEAMEKNLTKKGEMLEACTLPFLHKHIWDAYFKSFPESVQDLLLDLIINGPVNDYQLIYQKKITTTRFDQTKENSRTSYYNRGFTKVIIPPYDKILHTALNQYSHSRVYEPVIFFWPPNLCYLLLDYLDPKHFNVNLYNKDKKEELLRSKPGLQYFASEEKILNDLPGAMIHLGQNPLKLTNAGKPSLTSIKSFVKKSGLSEFYPHSTQNHLPSLRSLFVAPLIMAYPNNKLTDSVTYIKEAFQSKQFKTFILPVLLFSYLNSKTIRNYRAIQGDLFQRLSDILKGSMQNWFTAEELERSIKKSGIIPDFVDPYEGSNIYFENIPPKGYLPEEFRYYETMSARDHYFTRVVRWPGFRGFLFFLASWGLLEIIYEEPDVSVIPYSAYSVYDGLKYIRVTELGAYVFNHTKAYSGVIKRPFTLALDEDSLSILLTDGDTGLASKAISSFAKPVGGNRFTTNASLFLENCKTEDDLTHKISIFTSIFPGDLPANWSAFFSDISLKANPLKPTAEYHIFHVSENNKQLLHLLARDEELKKICIKAEKFHILVHYTNLTKLKNILRSYGYLIEL